LAKEHTFSFISTHENIHTKYMGTSGTVVKRNIESLTEKPVTKTANVLVMKDNLDHLSEIFNFLLEANFRNVIFNRMRPIKNLHRDLTIENPNLTERKEWAAQMLKIKEAATQKRGETNYSFSGNLVEKFKSPQKEVTASAPTPDAPMTRQCLQPWDTWFVNIHGHAKPCCGPFKNIGNVFSDTLVFGNEKHLALQASLRNGKLTEACKQCLMRPLGTTAELDNQLQGAGAFFKKD
jgi:sulfatase maturation enzyme AslB (radical SAM superfamily)